LRGIASRGRSWSPTVDDHCPAPHRDRHATPTCQGRVVAMSQSSPNGTATMGKPWADHGHEHHTAAPHATIERTAEQVLYKERTTGFEPATLTLAKKGEEIRPSGPSSPLTWCPVRLFVHPVRPARPNRIPVYHRTRSRRLMSTSSPHNSWAHQLVARHNCDARGYRAARRPGGPDC
jgi:hypothetical protein